MLYGTTAYALRDNSVCFTGQQRMLLLCVCSHTYTQKTREKARGFFLKRVISSRCRSPRFSGQKSMLILKKRLGFIPRNSPLSALLGFCRFRGFCPFRSRGFGVRYSYFHGTKKYVFSRKNTIFFLKNTRKTHEKSTVFHIKRTGSYTPLYRQNLRKLEVWQRNIIAEMSSNTNKRRAARTRENPISARVRA